MLRGRSVLQRWFTERGGGSTIEIDLKFIRADGLSQKKGFVDGHCRSNPWLGESSDADFKSDFI